MGGDIPRTFVPNWRSYPSAVSRSTGANMTPLADDISSSAHSTFDLEWSTHALLKSTWSCVSLLCDVVSETFPGRTRAVHTDLRNSRAAVLTAFKLARSRFRKMASLPVSCLSWRIVSSDCARFRAAM